MNKTQSLFIFCFIVTNCVFSQTKIDSLKLQFEESKIDSIKANRALDICFTLRRSDLDQALYYAKLAEDITSKSGLKETLMKSQLRKGDIQSSMGDYFAAIESYKKAIDLSEELEINNYLISAKTGLGNVYKRQENYVKAKAVYIEALHKAKLINNKSEEARIYNYLGSLNRILEQWEEAYKNYNLALKIVQDLDIKIGVSACLTNLGLVCYDMERYDKAEAYYMQAIKIKKELNDDLGLIRIYINLTNLYDKTGNKSLNEAYLKKAYELVKSFNNLDLLGSVLYNYADFRFKNNQFKASEDLLMEIIDIESQLKNSDILLKTYDLLAKVHANNNKNQLAYEFSTKSRILLDSITKNKIKLATNEIEAKYKNQQQEKELELLTAKNELQELNLKKRTNERNIIIIFVGVVFIILVLLYNLLRIKQKRHKELLELDKAKSVFFANISHEFRTPLTLILNPINKVLKNKKLSDDIQKNLNLVKTNADRLLSLIDQLLDLSKIEANKLKLKVSNCNISEYLSVLVEGFAFKAQEKSIKFNTHIDDSIQQGWVDKNAIERIVLNLLSNALKYTPNSGVVEFTSEINKGVLNITITNSGDGIDKNEIHRVFERFYQSDENKEGFGIGLSLVKELTELHKGKIELKTNNNWTIFKVDIPVALESYNIDEVKKQQLNIDSETEVKKYSSKILLNNENPVVLIVDDNKDIRTFLGNVFNDNYTLIFSNDGIDGLEKAQHYIPEIIISDVMMPKMNGIDFCKNIKSNEKTCHIPIMLLTAKGGDENIMEGIKAGAEDYIVKPFNDEHLLLKVTNIIESRQKMIEKITSNKSSNTNVPENLIGLDSMFFSKVQNILDKELSNPNFGSTEFSKSIGMSRMQLHRKLKALLGLSTSEFLRIERLKMAARLLKNSNENISEIGYQVGFNNHPYFSKAFKEYYNCTPSEYTKHVR